MRLSNMLARRGLQFAMLMGVLVGPQTLMAEQETLSDSVTGDGHMEIRGDQYGAFGPFSVSNPGAGSYDPTGPVGLRPWVFWSGMMLTDGNEFQWLMDVDDWPGDFGGRMMDDEVTSDVTVGAKRTSSFTVSRYEGLSVDLVQEVSAHNIVQTYTFKNSGPAALELKALWETDVDMEFAQGALENLAGIVLDEKPRVYFIEESDVPGEGHPGVADRNRRISVIADAGENVTFEGALAERPPQGGGGGTHLHFYAQQMHGIEEAYLNGVWEIVRGAGTPTVEIDDDNDNLMDGSGDVGGAMQFALNIPKNGSATLTLNFVGGALSNAVTGGNALPGDFNSNQQLDAADIDALTGATAAGNHPAAFDLTNDKLVNSADITRWVKDLRKTWIGDANLDGEFNSSDFVQAFQKGKYETGQAAVWTEGDWDGNGKFESSDFVVAFQDGGYEKGAVAAVSSVPEPALGVTGLLLLTAASVLRRGRRS